MKNLSLAFMLLFIIGFTSNAQETDTTPPAEEAVEAVVEAAAEAEAEVEDQAAEPEPEPEAEAEPEPEPEPEAEGGLAVLFVFLSGGGLMGLLQVLRKTGIGPHSIPARFRAFVAPAIALLSWGANQLFGAPLDFSMLEAILIGGGASFAHNAGSSAGFLSSSGLGK